MSSNRSSLFLDFAVNVLSACQHDTTVAILQQANDFPFMFNRSHISTFDELTVQFAEQIDRGPIGSGSDL